MRAFLRHYRSALAGHRHDAAARERLARDAHRGARLYATNILRRMLRGPAPSCTVPTTVVHLEDDPFLGPVVLAGLDDWVEDLRVVRRSGGHWWVRDRPEELAELLRALP